MMPVDQYSAESGHCQRMGCSYCVQGRDNSRRNKEWFKKTAGRCGGDINEKNVGYHDVCRHCLDADELPPPAPSEPPPPGLQPVPPPPPPALLALPAPIEAPPREAVQAVAGVVPSAGVGSAAAASSSSSTDASVLARMEARLAALEFDVTTLQQEIRELRRSGSDSRMSGTSGTSDTDVCIGDRGRFYQ